jgi:lactate dehydrogenase-like 2-hydroxyacid dehydrogenase
MKPDLFVVGPIYPPALKIIDDTYTTHKLWLAADKDAFISSVADRCVVAATSGTNGMRAALMDKLPKLKLIAHFGVGVDSLDTDAAKSRGITITNTPDVLTEEVADLTLALLLATMRRVCQGDRYVRSGQWPVKGPMPLTDSLQGKTVGIMGMGRIGKAIARRCEAFHLKIAYQGPNRKPDLSWAYYADPVALAKDVDIIICAFPGGDSTKGLVSRAVIEALGPQGILVNIARGSVVDEDALVEALASGKLGGAGLDVFVHEPKVPEALFKLDNVVLLPHVGSATHPTRMAMGQLQIDNLAAWFAGKPLLTPY